MTIRVSSLHVYPVKSCRGIDVQQTLLTNTGVAFDRQWMVVNAAGRFLTQREYPRMALIQTGLYQQGLRLDAPGMPTLQLSMNATRSEQSVTVWRDTLIALDEGSEAANWLSKYLQADVKLVQFDPRAQRKSSAEWTGDVVALNQFSDGYSILVISEASLADLNSRLPSNTGPLPMNRFRPNIVLSGVNAYDEDRLHEIKMGAIRLRIVKPCTRCKITTTDQTSGEVRGDEPITTLKSYRWDAKLRGVTFGQNIIVIEGIGETLSTGQEVVPVWK